MCLYAACEVVATFSDMIAWCRYCRRLQASKQNVIQTVLLLHFCLCYIGCLGAVSSGILLLGVTEPTFAVNSVVKFAWVALAIQHVRRAGSYIIMMRTLGKLYF